MCLTPFKIKSVNPISPRLAFVPCGKCKECRDGIKNAWSMRLALELETAQNNGWKVGFCTLTYNDENLPHFPAEALDKNCLGYFSKDGFLPPCFDRKQVRDFIINIRRDLHSVYHTKGLKYMVCSEYGSHTQRPHYHCIFAWQDETVCYDDNDAKYVVGCSPENFYELIKKYWKFGFVFPRHFKGGRDVHGYLHQPFLVSGSARFAGAYAGKYCCKDLNFVQSLKGFKFDKKSKEYKNGDCFHIQNKSLGLSWLSNKSPEQLKDYLFKGIGFAGDEKLHQMPLYLRNKLYFTPYYIIERRVFDGIRLVTDETFVKSYDDDFLRTLGFRVEYKRLVRRKCNDFFFKYKQEIYDRKVKFWTDTFRGVCDADWLKSKDFPSLENDYLTPYRLALSNENMRSGIPFEEIASYYVSRYGIPYKYQYDVKDVDLWSMRYTLKKVPESFKGAPLITETEFNYMNDICCFYLSTLGLVYKQESADEKLIEYIKDKYKHME